jgi:Ca-activated chloride channel family protein
LVLVGRYSGKGSGKVAIEGRVNGQARTFTYDGQFPERATDNDFIPRLWATRRVGYLLDEIRLHGENAELREEVTELARKYGIVTPYTAYLIVEDEGRRQVETSLRSMSAMQQDSYAMAEAAATYETFKTQRGGDAGVAAARSGMELRNAQAVAPSAARGRMEAQRRYGLAPAASPTGPVSLTTQPAPTTAERLQSYTSQSQFAAGKTFYLNGEVWVDSEIQKHPAAEKVTLRVGSPEYLEFARKNPRALAWLAIGTQVHFYFGGKVYQLSQ